MESIVFDTWKPVSTVPPLSTDSIHLWRFPNLLHNRVHRRRILSEYLNIAPEKLQFKKGRHGKPYVDWPQTTIQFSISHSNSLCLMAVHPHIEIGIDIERIQPRTHMLKIAHRMFTPQISDKLANTPPNNRLKLFYYHWTQLEAQIKACGSSLFNTNLCCDATSIYSYSFIPDSEFQGCLAAFVPIPTITQWNTLILNG